MVRLRLLALAREFQVERDARLEERAVFLADQVAAPIGQTGVQHRHDVDVQTRAAERHRDRVGLGLDLVGAEIGERLAQPFRQVVQQRAQVVRGVRPAHVDSHVDVVERAQGGALGQTSGQHDPLQREIRVVGDVGLQLLADAPGLGSVLIRTVLRQIDLFLGEAQNFTIVDMDSRHGQLLSRQR